MLASLAALAAVILLPAHASVIGTTPADGDTVSEQPGSFGVVMNEEILSLEGADANRLQLTDASGLFYGDGCVAVDGDTVSMDAELGPAGEYTLAYQVVSGDGHPVDGAVRFAFEPAEGQEGAAGSESAPVCGAPVESEGAATGAAAPVASSGPVASADADEADAGTAATDAPAEGEGGGFPFIAVGVLALLAVLAVVAYTVNRGYRQRRDEL
jgi:methionine-rich copper-binding protein CopC